MDNQKFENHNICDEHKKDCILHKDNKGKFGSAGIETIITYHRYDFFITTYCDCLRGGLPQNEFVEKLLNNAMKNSKKIDYYDINRSNISDKKLRKRIKEHNLLSMKCSEVNYIYYNAAVKEYAICSTINFIDVFKNSNLIDNNYNKAIEYINNSDLDYLKDNLTKLYDFNRPIVFGGIKHSTINELNKHFKKSINEKQKKL